MEALKEGFTMKTAKLMNISKRDTLQPLKVGFVASSFDLLHAGHCLMLKDAKSQCDWLVAALQSNPCLDRPEKNKPIQSMTERRIQLESIRYVDEIRVYETEKDLLFMLKRLRPDVRVLGTDYKGKSFTGDDLDIEVYYHDRDHDWSTTGLRDRIINEN